MCGPRDSVSWASQRGLAGKPEPVITVNLSYFQVAVGTHEGGRILPRTEKASRTEENGFPAME